MAIIGSVKDSVNETPIGTGSTSKIEQGVAVSKSPTPDLQLPDGFSVGDDSLVGAPTSTAQYKGQPTYTAAQVGPASLASSQGYTAAQLSDPTKWNVDNNQTVRGQLSNILSSDSPIIQQARTRAAQAANDRGLSNSSLALTAGESAAYDAATPIATADAAAYGKAAGYNADEQNQFAVQNVGAQNNALQFGANATNTASMFNAGQINQNAQFNAGQQNSVGVSNMQEAGTTGRFNVQQTNTAGLQTQSLNVQQIMQQQDLLSKSSINNSQLASQQLIAANNILSQQKINTENLTSNEKIQAARNIIDKQIAEGNNAATIASAGASAGATVTAATLNNETARLNNAASLDFQTKQNDLNRQATATQNDLNRQATATQNADQIAAGKVTSENSTTANLYHDYQSRISTIDNSTMSEDAKRNATFNAQLDFNQGLRLATQISSIPGLENLYFKDSTTGEQLGPQNAPVPTATPAPEPIPTFDPYAGGG